MKTFVCEGLFANKSLHLFYCIYNPEIVTKDSPAFSEVSLRTLGTRVRARFLPENGDSVDQERSEKSNLKRDVEAVLILTENVNC